jgi:murein DD-endopeptidase MepM/ murein hydrolase activator NlpD
VRLLRAGFACAVALTLLLGTSGPTYAARPPSRQVGAVTIIVPAWPARDSTLTGVAAHYCHHASAWGKIGKDNRITTPPYYLRAGQRLTVRCAALASPRVAVATSGWVHPVPGAVCVSGFRTLARPTHNGIDLPRPWGTPIHAAHAGTVVFKGWQRAKAGYYVVLAHPGGLFTVYMHMPRPSFRAISEHVSTGAVIGYVGATGNATGPHLHFEVQTHLWVHYLNPAVFLRAHGVRVVGC